MRTFTILIASLTLAACGGSESKTADAKLATDAPGGTPDAPGGTPDAPAAGLTGLGQKCDQSANTCPASAPDCIAVNAAGSWCTPRCVEGATGMTGATAPAQFTSLTPAPDNAKCTAQFTGSVGMPVCAVILETTPSGALMTNTAYTNVSFGCAVLCGTGMACPSGMTCDPSVGPGVCIPD